MNVESTTKMSLAEVQALVLTLAATVEELKATVQPKRNESQREMTDDDALRIMTGDHAASKHKDAAAALGLSYGQVYSCRGEYTFKHIHKQLKGTEGFKNSWIKA